MRLGFFPRPNVTQSSVSYAVETIIDESLLHASKYEFEDELVVTQGVAGISSS
jgi:hypothetical protein